MAYVSRTVSAARVASMSNQAWAALLADLTHEDSYGALQSPTAAIDATVPSVIRREPEEWEIGWATMPRAPIGPMIDANPRPLEPVMPQGYADEPTQIRDEFVSCVTWIRD